MCVVIIVTIDDVPAVRYIESQASSIPEDIIWNRFILQKSYESHLFVLDVSFFLFKYTSRVCYMEFNFNRYHYIASRRFFYI